MAQPAYRRVADSVRDAIEAGQYQPGDKVPSAIGLAKEYAISQETALKALRLLAREGWINLVPRGRATVRSRPRDRIVVRDRTVYRDKIGYYFDRNAQNWRAVDRPRRYLGIPPAHVADILGISREEDVIVRDRGMGTEEGGQALQLATSYIPVAVAAEIPALRAENTGKGGIYYRVEDHFNAPIEWHETISARLPDEEEQGRLGIPAMTPVLVVTRESRVQRGNEVVVVEVNETRMAAEQFAVSYSVQRDASAPWPRPDEEDAD